MFLGTRCTGTGWLRGLLDRLGLVFSVLSEDHGTVDDARGIGLRIELHIYS